MAYTWTDGELITAAKLNNTGGGGGFLDITDTEGVLDKTWTEIFTALSDGEIPRIISSDGEYFVDIRFLNSAIYDGEFYFVYILGEANAWYQASTSSGYPVYTED